MFNTDGNTTVKEETNKNGLNKPMDNKNKRDRSSYKGNNGFKENMEKTDSRDDSEYLSLVFKSQEETKKVLNTFIKDFLEKSGMEETATTFGIENANNFLEPFDRASNTEEEKILEAFKIKRSFLNEWWQIFWDVFNAKTHKNGSTIAQEYYSFNVSRQHLDFLCRQGSMKAAFEQQMSERRGDYQMEAMQQYSSMSALNVPNSFSDKGGPMMHMGQGLTQNPYQAFFHSQQQQQSPNTSNMQQKQLMLNIQQLQQQSPNATTMQKQQMLHIQQQQLQQIQQLQQQMHQQQKSVYQKANINNNSNNNTPTSATTTTTAAATSTTNTTKKNKNNTSNASEKQQQQQKKNNNKQGTGLTKQQMVQQRLAKVSPMVVTPEFPAAVKNKQVNTAINQMNINSNITNNLNSKSFSNVSNMSSFNDQLASMAKELENSSDSMMITNMDNFPNPNINKDSKNT
ncbi:hypothetical protein ACO0SA_002832 [Hanseniaspora valbyensis]